MQELLEWMEYIEDTRQQRKVTAISCIYFIQTAFADLEISNAELNKKRAEEDSEEAKQRILLSNVRKICYG